MDPHARDVVVYSLQIGGLTAACAAAAWTIRLPMPSMRFVYWRAVVALCVLLPFWPARVVDVALARATSVIVPPVVPAASSGTFTAAIGHADAAHSLTWSSLLAAGFVKATAGKWITVLLVVGVAGRLLWLAAGLLSLSRLAATAGDPIVEPELGLLRRQIAPQAEVRWHPTLTQAVTFGARRPVVLLPEYLSQHPIEIQRAVLCHELMHAARADWLQSLVEQIVVACFWFHPAVWWAVGQIELSREQIVDRLVVAVTGSRRSYLQALLAFADRPALTPATAFAGRRQLALRIKQLSEEVAMSRWRFGITTAALAAVMSASVWAIASAMPLRTEVRYHALPVAGGVAASAALSEQQPPAPAAAGTRTDTAGPDPIRQPVQTVSADRAVDLALWNDYISRTQATIRALALEEAQVGVLAAAVPRGLPAYPELALKYGVGATLALTATVTANGDVIDVKTSKWNLTIDRDIQDVGYWASQPQRAFIDACEAVVRQAKVAPRPEEITAYVTFTFDPGSPRGSIGVRWDYGPTPTSAPSAAHFSRGVSFSTAPVRVGGDVRAPRPIAHTDPIYPRSALAARIQGVVIIQATIGPDGLVDDAEILRSVSDLDQAALDAVSQWQYEPVLLNGVAIPVIMTVTVNFALR